MKRKDQWNASPASQSHFASPYTSLVPSYNWRFQVPEEGAEKKDLQGHPPDNAKGTGGTFQLILP